MIVSDKMTAAITTTMVMPTTATVRSTATIISTATTTPVEKGLNVIT